MMWIDKQSPEDKAKQDNIITYGKIPKHIAIIMDGNGRWATGLNKPRVFGHKEGIESVRDIVNASSLIGVEYLTLYAFSTENWKRPAAEVNALMKLLETYLKKEINELHENNVRIRTIGKTTSLPSSAQRILFDSIEKTESNDGLNLVLALSYSGRWDIVRAMQMIALDARRGKLSPEDINEEYFSNALQTKGMPDPDLLIRTSGEMRISNFLLWELAYTEMYITSKLWPEFRRDDLYQALIDYSCRERRFGKISSQLMTTVSKEAVENQETTNSNSYLKRVVDAFKNK
jgi:undecaprenyl diphosphate synthase